LSLVRAKEIVQALLAEAFCKAKLSSGEVVSPNPIPTSVLPAQRATAPDPSPCEPLARRSQRHCRVLRRESKGRNERLWPKCWVPGLTCGIL
jgi:hypothetical protein